MKKYFLVLFTTLLVSGCGVEIKSVVDNSSGNAPYKNPLIVIAYNDDTKNFTNLLKQKIEDKFKVDKNRVEIITFARSKKELELNSSDDINDKINTAMMNDSKDLILFFNPTKLEFYNSGLQSATYVITGKDTKTRREVWKAEFTSSSSFGPSLFAEKAATKIYEKLKMDHIIQTAVNSVSN